MKRKEGVVLTATSTGFRRAVRGYWHAVLVIIGLAFGFAESLYATGDVGGTEWKGG